jgi:hypothetical protein
MKFSKNKENKDQSFMSNSIHMHKNISSNIL